MGYMEQLRLPANHESLPLHAHLCLMLRVRFLLREQIEVGRHDDVRSLVRSGKMPQTIMNHKGANCHRKAGQCSDSFISIILSVDHIECIMTLTEIKRFYLWWKFISSWWFSGEVSTDSWDLAAVAQQFLFGITVFSIVKNIRCLKRKSWTSKIPPSIQQNQKILSFSTEYFKS